MTIIDKIRGSIQNAFGEGFHVYYHDEPTLNLLADRMTFPCAIVQLITQGAAEEQSGQFREIVSAAVFFLELSKFDFDADANEEIINRCKVRAFQWLSIMQYDPYIELQAVERTSRVYEEFDAILTGFGVMARLKELQGISNCVGDFNDDFNEDFNK